MNEKLLTPVQDGRTNPAIEFLDGQCMLRMITQGGTLIEKLVSMESLREAATNIPVDSGWLEPEIVRWGLLKGMDFAAAFIPPARHTIEMTSGTPGPDEQLERITVPLPGMALFGIANKYFAWAVKTGRLDPHREVFRAPLPNVYQDGLICWGVLKPPSAGPRTILKAWQLFISSTFNNHAASGKSKAQRDDIREVLKALARAGEEAVYPVEDLVRQREGTGVTLDQMIREFFESGEMPI